MATKFDGVTARISVPDNNYDGLNTGTVEFWIKRNTVSANEKLFFKNGVIDIGINNSGAVFGEIVGVENLGIFGSNEADNQWHNIAMTWDGSFLRGYIDGIYKGRIAQIGIEANNANTLYLGRRDTTEPYAGILDQVRISNIARYVTEVSYSVNMTPFLKDANTLLLYYFDEVSGTSATDASGNTNTGTLENAVSWITGIFPSFNTALT